MAVPLLEVRGLRKQYRHGLFGPPTFSLEADFAVREPAIVGVLGPNGSGKTTLFELIAGGNQPMAGVVLCDGQDIHRVRSDERDRLATLPPVHQVRRFRRRVPNALLARAGRDCPLVHLFDEPLSNVHDGYIGSCSCSSAGCAPSGGWCSCSCTRTSHLDILREIADRFVFVQDGRLTHADDWGGAGGAAAGARVSGGVDRIGVLTPGYSCQGGAGDVGDQAANASAMGAIKQCGAGRLATSGRGPPTPAWATT